MKELKIAVIFLFIVVIGTLLVPPGPALEVVSVGVIDVLFSPVGGCEQAIVEQIDQSKSEILCLAYSFTSRPLFEALQRAFTRGIMIKVVLDKSQKFQKSSMYMALIGADIPVWIDSRHKIMHDKIMLIDRRVVITGSYNFTVNAELNNAENLLILKDNKPLYDLYRDNFQTHFDHSKRVNGAR